MRCGRHRTADCPGGAFPITGPLQYAMTTADAVELLTPIKPATIVPVHYDGWSHFRKSCGDAERALDTATEGLRTAVRWLDPGVPFTITV